MLNGFDLSHHNGDAQVANVYPRAQFICHKLTESTGYTDPKAKARAAAWKGEKPIFWYHLIRPDKGNTAAAEASHFIAKIATIEEYGPFGLALDLEANYVPYNSGKTMCEWVCDLIRKIRVAYNKTVLVYMGDLYPDYWYDEIRKAGGAIWIARWGKNPTHPYEVWQDTSRYEGGNLDHDVSPLSIEEMWSLVGDSSAINVSMTAEELADLAHRVLKGEFGTGSDRKAALGDKYYKVQRIVNAILQEV